MGSERCSWALRAVVASTLLLGCGASSPRYALAPVVTRDQDLDAIAHACKKNEKGEEECSPELYVSPFVWDGVDNTLFRPLSRVFAADPAGPAANVNALDELPDSSWFVNRIGVKPMTPQEVASGYCAEGPVLDPNDEDGSWVIDHGKDNGANPGFRVKVRGTKYMFKLDEVQVERATAATAIAARFYYAAGYWAPCDSVVYFRRSLLRLTPGLTIQPNVGKSIPLDDKRLDEMLIKTGRRGPLYRATASRWLPGVAVGPFTYAGRRDDDPSDVIPHEDRRDLRGARILAAWLNHFDTREQNTMATWMAADTGREQSSPGHVRHWIIDLGDCFGSQWSIDDLWKRLGYSNVFDWGDIGYDFVTLGAVERPWDRGRIDPEASIFGYYRTEDFVPDDWRGEYPNPAFGRMQEDDAAWGTRILARFTPDHIRAVVRIGDFTNPKHEEFLVKTLIERQAILQRRYFRKLSPVTDLRTTPRGEICGVDLARRTNTYEPGRFAYRATYEPWGGKPTTVRVTTGSDGEVCLDTPVRPEVHGKAEQDPLRAGIYRLWNGASDGPLVVHVRDLAKGPGERPHAIVGIERPKG